MTGSGEPPHDRLRLDLALVERGLVATRSRARDFIKRSLVLVDGSVVSRPGVVVAGHAKISLVENIRQYVSRGGEKLSAALTHFSFTARDLVALDIGASTGGFSEVLLESGAKRVYAVDVGYDQLHDRLRRDARIVSLEECDARELTAGDIPEPIGAIVADVSFISLKQVLVRPLEFVVPGGWMVALVKPQFEVGRKGMLGKGGIVRDENVQEEAVAGVRDWVSQLDGWDVIDVIDSPILGKTGNHEFLLGARYGG